MERNILQGSHDLLRGWLLDVHEHQRVPGICRGYGGVHEGTYKRLLQVSDEPGAGFVHCVVSCCSNLESTLQQS